MDALVVVVASMRPQLFAADHRLARRDGARDGGASMRPQLFAADHRAERAAQQPAPVASMRPQLFAADHGQTVGPSAHFRALLQ